MEVVLTESFIFLRFYFKTALLVFVLFNCHLTFVHVTKQDNRREYCVYERFVARCAPDEIILITSALFGRMRARRCITDEYENTLGCFSDVTSHLSALCSGRRDCSLLVATMDTIVQPCPKDMKSYLETSYNCHKASFLENCRGRPPMNHTEINESRGYLALYYSLPTSSCSPPSLPLSSASSSSSPSSLSHASRLHLSPVGADGCSPCPWLIRAELGQRISVSWVYDPVSSLDSSAGPPGDDLRPNVSSRRTRGRRGTCPVVEFVDGHDSVRYHTCVDVDRGKSDQWGNVHQGLIHTSRTNELLIRVISYSTSGSLSSDHNYVTGSRSLFVWKYTVLGCRDISPPDGALVWRYDDSAVIACNRTQLSWYLTCNKHGHWIGDTGNCSQYCVLLASIIGVSLGLLTISCLFAMFVVRKDHILGVRSLSNIDDNLQQRRRLTEPIDVIRSHPDCFMCAESSCCSLELGRRRHYELKQLQPRCTSADYSSHLWTLVSPAAVVTSQLGATDRNGASGFGCHYERDMAAASLLPGIGHQRSVSSLGNDDCLMVNCSKATDGQSVNSSNVIDVQSVVNISFKDWQTRSSLSSSAK